jgi:ornithine cyclodeaminase
MNVTDCRNVTVWGRTGVNLARYRAEMEPTGFSIDTTLDTHDLAANCSLIVTTTPSAVPLLSGDQIQRGTHITAVGADTPHKQELEPAILQQADLVVADSILQCLERGEIAHAIEEQVVEKEALVELGQIISGQSPGRTSDDQITVADLTGVAVQDIQIAKAVYETVR